MARSKKSVNNLNPETHVNELAESSNNTEVAPKTSKKATKVAEVVQAAETPKVKKTREPKAVKEPKTKKTSKKATKAVAEPAVDDAEQPDRVDQAADQAVAVEEKVAPKSKTTKGKVASKEKVAPKSKTTKGKVAPKGKTAKGKTAKGKEQKESKVAKQTKTRFLSSARLRRALNFYMNGSKILDDIVFVKEFVETHKENNTTKYTVKGPIKFSKENKTRKAEFSQLCDEFNKDLKEDDTKMSSTDPLDMLRVLRAQKYRFNAGGLNTINGVVFNMVKSLISNGLENIKTTGHKTIRIEDIINNIRSVECYALFRSLSKFEYVVDLLNKRNTDLLLYKENMKNFNKQMKKLKTEKAQTKFAEANTPAKPEDVKFEFNAGEFLLYSKLAWSDMKLNNPELNEFRIKKESLEFMGSLVAEFVFMLSKMFKTLLENLFKSKKTINASLTKTIIDMMCIYNNSVHAELDNNMESYESGLTIQSLTNVSTLDKALAEVASDSSDDE